MAVPYISLLTSHEGALLYERGAMQAVVGQRSAVNRAKDSGDLRRSR